MNPIFILFFLILGLPTLEIYLLIEIGSDIGALPTVFLVVFTAVLGTYLVRRQGISTLMRVQQTLDRGEVPALELLEGAMLLFGGLLLLIPGFFTDALGFLCLVPGLRKWLLVGVARRFHAASAVARRDPGADPQRPVHGRIIEGEFRRDND